MNPGQVQPSSNVPGSDSLATRSSQLVNDATTAVKDATHKVKEKVSSQYHQVRDYISATDLETSLRDAKMFAGKHPLATAAVGVGLGVLIGKLMRR